MVRFVLGFILSLVITNWLYSEIVIVYPEFEGQVNRFMERATIPTHDRFDMSALYASISEWAGGIKRALSLNISGRTHRKNRVSNAPVKRNLTHSGYPSEYKLFEMLTGEDAFREKAGAKPLYL